MIPTVSGTSKTLGLIGNGIAYSLSPAIHNFSAALLGIDQVYVPIDVPKEDLLSVVRALWSMGSPGFNVTQPFKAAIVPFLVHTPGPSINTAYRGELGFHGVSTDGLGFQKAVERLGTALRDFASIMVIGSGGAAAAILYHLETIGFNGAVTIHSRTPMTNHFKNLQVGTAPLTPAEVRRTAAKLPQNSLLIQATSAPHKGDDLQSLAGTIDDFQGAVVDLCYGKVSKILEAAQNKGLRSQDGIPMLIEQARESQRHWWGTSAPYAQILAHLKKDS